ncbi:MAG: hypothetical protein LBR17_08350 [Bacteroidales bacterium]|jgi:hypothetical protein|nr:hypothetical protein [Bacteroidales bacterium]
MKVIKKTMACAKNCNIMVRVTIQKKRVSNRTTRKISGNFLRKVSLFVCLLISLSTIPVLCQNDSTICKTWYKGEEGWRCCDDILLKGKVRSFNNGYDNILFNEYGKIIENRIDVEDGLFLYQYDDDNNLKTEIVSWNPVDISTTTYDYENGKLMKENSSVWGEKFYEYDDKGQLIKEYGEHYEGCTYAKYNEFSSKTATFYKNIYKYDKGKITDEYRYYRGNTLIDYSFCVCVKHIHYVYDEDKKLIAESRYGDDNYYSGMYDYEMILYKYNNKKLIEKQIKNIDYLGIYSKTIIKYNEQGDVFESTKYDDNGKVIEQETYVYKYDKMGNWIERKDNNGHVAERMIEYYE